MKSISSVLCSGKRTGVAVAILFLLVAFSVTASAQTAPKADPWAQFQFLLGDWKTGTDSSGVEGGTTFNFDLDGKVLVRKNFANYPASKIKPAINHKDLMVIHPNGAAPAEADYWDNEGHTIHYIVTVNGASDTLQFTSSIISSAPRFRLSYVKLGIDSLRVLFEAAPPGSPDSFSPYVSGTVYRKR